MRNEPGQLIGRILPVLHLLFRGSLLYQAPLFILSVLVSFQLR